MAESNETSTDSPTLKLLIDLSIESWRFSRAFSRLLGKLGFRLERRVRLKPKSAMRIWRKCS